MPAPPEPDATVPPTSRPEEVGSSIPPALARNPHYRIEREIGRGGMGIVYLAHNTILYRPEVLKVIGHALLERPGASERFLREMRAAARLNHPNVVAAYTALSDGTFLALAMEFVPGEDLAKLVRRVGPLSVQQACFYTGQVAAGLQHAHEHGMVHRDIKPSNLIVSTAGKRPVVKILDFGLVKAAETSGAGGLTASGAMLGTPEYMAPEQALNAATADIRSDIYSLGCTLYFLLAGDTPYPAPNIYAMMHAHQTAPPPDPAKFRKDVSDELAEVIAKMMAKLPINRYQTPVQAAKALMPFFKTGWTTEQKAVDAAVMQPQQPASKPRVLVAEVVDESIASGESERPVSLDGETEPPVHNTPVIDRLPARSYQIDSDKFGEQKKAAGKPLRRRQRDRRYSRLYSFGIPVAVFLTLGMTYLVFVAPRDGWSTGQATVLAGNPETAAADLLSWEGHTSDWTRVDDSYVNRKETRGAGRRYICCPIQNPNFELSFDIKLTNGDGLAGFHVRSEISRSGVNGPQIAFGDGVWGEFRYFLDDSRTTPTKITKVKSIPATYNLTKSAHIKVKVFVQGSIIQYSLNGLEAVIFDVKMMPQGRIGFFIDDVNPANEVTIRNVRLKLMP